MAEQELDLRILLLGFCEAARKDLSRAAQKIISIDERDPSATVKQIEACQELIDQAGNCLVGAHRNAVKMLEAGAEQV